jgi:hypothetical protein
LRRIDRAPYAARAWRRHDQLARNFRRLASVNNEVGIRHDGRSLAQIHLTDHLIVDEILSLPSEKFGLRIGRPVALRLIRRRQETHGTRPASSGVSTRMRKSMKAPVAR